MVEKKIRYFKQHPKQHPSYTENDKMTGNLSNLETPYIYLYLLFFLFFIVINVIKN